MANTIGETFPTLTIFNNKPLDFECPYCGCVNSSYECRDPESKWVGVCCRCWRYFPIDELDVLEENKKDVKLHKKSYGTVFGKSNNTNY